MQFTHQQKYAFAVLAAAFVLMALVAVTLPARAEFTAPPAVPQNVLLVPTPITTPSSLDALSLTSNLTVGGNQTVAGTLGVTGLVTINGVKCYKGQQSVLGSATAIPATLTAAGITTPTWAQQSFAAAPGNTYWNTAHVNASGVITFSVYQALLSGTVTPQAATTTVALDYEVCGQ